MKCTRSKKGVSEMMSYALIIIIVLGLSVIVFAYLNLSAPKERFECTDDISLILKDASCSVLEANPACGITGPTLDIAAVLENKGNHKIGGAYLRLGAPESEVKELINKNSLFFNFKDVSAPAQVGILPGTSFTFITHYENPQEITPGTLDLEIQPFVGTPENFLVCGESVVNQRVVCGKGNSLPTVSITQVEHGSTPLSSGSTVFLSDTLPSSIAFTIAANDCDGSIERVQLWQRATAQAEGIEEQFNIAGTGTYTFERELSTLTNTPGQYIYTAVAYDNKGDKSFSAPFLVTYLRNIPPVIKLSIFNDRGFISQAESRETVTLRAQASDSDGTVQSVQFYEVDDTLGGYKALLGTRKGSGGTYELTLGPRSVGDHKFVAYATDNLEVSTLSNELTLKIVPTPLPLGAPIVLIGGTYVSEGGSGTVTVKRGEDVLIDKCKEAECKPAPEVKVVVGDMLTLIAEPAAESQFSAWGNVPAICPPLDAITGLASCKVEVKNDIAFKAAFQKICFENPAADIGDKPDIAGSTTRKGIEKQDTCILQGNNNRLIEYYCSGTNTLSQEWKCSSCRAGICQNPQSVGSPRDENANFGG